jgi:hypothetical protein
VICSEDGNGKFQNIHRIHWIWPHMTTSFRKWKTHCVASTSGSATIPWRQQSVWQLTYQ